MKTAHARRRPCPVALASLCVLLLHAGIADAQVPGSLQTDPLHLRLLSVLSGRALPSSATPWSGAAALRALEGLPGTLADGSPGVAAEAIESLRRDDVTMVDIRFATRLEYYLRPPDPLSFADRLEMIDPIGMLEMSYQAGLPLTVFIQATLQREYQMEFLAPSAVSNLPSPLPGNPVALENNDVMAGYLLYAPGPFEIVFGRQRFSLGPSPLTSLIVSRSVPYLDALNVGLSLGRLRMTLFASTLENREARGDNTGLVTVDYDFDKTVILYNVHYFEYDFGFIRAGIGGQVVLIRPANAFQLADFFPVFSWHNADIVPNNLSLIMDVSAVPLPGLELYAQLGFDDINASFVTVDGSIPTITAGLVGAAWHQRWPRSSLEAVLEAGFTHYLWGSFDDQWYLGRAICRVHVDGANEWIPLTSPFGPGTIWVLARATLETPWDLDAVVKAQFLLRNPQASLTGTYDGSEAIANAALDPSFKTSVELSYAPLRWLRVTLEPVLQITSAKAWMELSIGAGTILEGKWRVRGSRR